jgi:DNA-binding CsgD family transcriptional regulator
MEPLSANDTQCLLQAIQALYALHDLDTFHLQALAIVDQLVPSEVPMVCLANTQSHQTLHLLLPGYPGFTPEMEAVPRQHWREHPLIWNLPHTSGGAYKISDFITQTEFHQLEGLYQQLLKVMGCEDQMAIFLSETQRQTGDRYSQANATLVVMSLNRSQRNFKERDRLLLNLLRPHLFQAYCNVQHYEKLQQELNQLQQSLNHLGLVILNVDGQVQQVTPQALVWLVDYFPKQPCPLQLPEHLWAWVKHQITNFIEKPALLNVCLPLRIQQDGKQLVIRLVVEQSAERYLLLLEEQTLSVSKSLELLGLSDRETDVLFWVIQGKANKAIAAQLNIGSSTVRKHLESIYRKLGVQSRTEAIAQALEKLGVLTSPLLTESLHLNSHGHS